MEEIQKEPTQRVPQPLSGTDLWVSTAAGVVTAFLLGWIFILTADPTELYGTAFFAGLPFIAGLISTLINGRYSIPTMKQSCSISCITYLLISFIVMIVGKEGVICMLMALPIALPTMIFGSRVGAWIYTATHKKNIHPASFGLLPILPILTISSSKFKLEPVARVETTEVIVDAAPEKIWPMLFKLDQLSGPVWLPFQAGIAHPIAVSSKSEAVGSQRDCLLSTGDMIERIAAVQKYRLLRFDVLYTPPTMKELNPFWEVKSAHLSGYYTCKEGEFRLIPLPNGKTKLIGTSWYEHRIYPAFYWNMWTDSIVEHVHTSVMNEIKRRAETRK